MATTLNPVGVVSSGGSGGTPVGSSLAMNIVDESISGSQFYNYTLPGPGQYKIIFSVKRDGPSGPVAFLPHIGLASSNDAYNATSWDFDARIKASGVTAGVDTYAANTMLRFTSSGVDYQYSEFSLTLGSDGDAAIIGRASLGANGSSYTSEIIGRSSTVRAGDILVLSSYPWGAADAHTGHVTIVQEADFT